MGGWTYSDDYYKNYTRDTWDEAAPFYETGFARQLAPFGHALLAFCDVSLDDHVLDLATGPGEPALHIAESMERATTCRGSVTGVDLSPAMIAIAARRAAERGLGRARFLVEDAEALSFADATFDVALSRFGFQIITDPEAAARELVRVVKPGGRIGLTVWSVAERNPGLHAVVGPMLAHAEPDETGYLPTPYELGGPGELAALLEAAGCTDTRETLHPGFFTAPSVDDYWRMTMEGTPLGHSLREEPDAVQRAVEADARVLLAQGTDASGAVRLAVTAVLVAARVP